MSEAFSVMSNTPRRKSRRYLDGKGLIIWGATVMGAKTRGGLDRSLDNVM